MASEPKNIHAGTIEATTNKLSKMFISGPSGVEQILYRGYPKSAWPFRKRTAAMWFSTQTDAVTAARELQNAAA
jgi:hypothetical protein